MYALEPHPARVGTGNTVEHVLLGLAAAFVLFPAVFGDGAGGFARAVLRWRALAWVGLVSYAVYLCHANVIDPINNRVMGHDLAHPYVWVVAVSFPTVCAIAAASYYLLERPILRLTTLPPRQALAARPARMTARSGRG